MAREDPRGFVAQGGDRTLVVDEAQLAPGMTRALKAAVDRDRRPGRFLLTGSSDLLRMPGLGDSLAGRAVTLRLRGFSVGEAGGLRDDFVSGLLVLTDPRRFHTTWNRHRYVDAMVRGGFPDVRLLSGRVRNAWLDGYVDRVLNRDAALLQSGHQSARLLALIRLIAASQDGELVKARLAEQAGLPATSITPYLDVLKGIFAIEELPPWAANLTTREIGGRKVAVADSALALRLAGLTVERLQPVTAEVLGSPFEAFVAIELMKQQSWSNQDFRLAHYRDRRGTEVDLIIEVADGTVIGVEVKTSSTYRTEHFKGLRFLRDALGDRFRCGVVLSMAEHGHQLSDRLIGLPAAALWELES